MSNPTDAILRRSPAGAILGEGPLWSKRDQCVYWVDILSNNLHACYLDGRSNTWHFPEHITWVIERENKPGFIAGLMSGFAEVTLEPFSIKHIANPYPHEPENRMNDAKADDLGRIWAGSMHKPITQVSGAFYRLDTDMSFREVDGPYKIANGPTFAPDHKKVWHTDTAKSEIYVFDVIDGELANKRLWLTFPENWGSPDGMTTDAQGGIWIAHWTGEELGVPGRVTRFHEDATEDFHIDLPALQITSLCFAGNDLNRVFVTSAAEGLPQDREGGTLFEIPSEALRGHTGLESMKFKG